MYKSYTLHFFKENPLKASRKNIKRGLMSDTRSEEDPTCEQKLERAEATRS